MKRFDSKSASEIFLDGCHRYGWLITVIANLVFFAYFTGIMTERLEDVKQRVDRVEKQIDQVMRRP